jgi:hypothetical protein
MSAHDGGVEHLNEMGRRTHRGERVEEGLEDASLAQAVEAFPHAVPMTEALRQSAPANVLDGEEMKRLEEAAIVLGLPAGKRGTPQACAPNRPHPSSSTLAPVETGMIHRTPTESEAAESQKQLLSKFRPHSLGLVSYFRTDQGKG